MEDVLLVIADKFSNFKIMSRRESIDDVSPYDDVSLNTTPLGYDNQFNTSKKQ